MKFRWLKTVSLILMSAIFVLLTSLSQTLAQTPPSDPEINLFILAGQSNMVGSQSNLKDLPYTLQGQQNEVLWFDQSDQWVKLQAPTEPLPFSNSKYPSSPAIAAGVGFGPEVSVGLELQVGLGKPVALVKYASNGSTLAEDWQPGKPMYQQMRSRVERAIAQLQSQGYKVVPKGFFWLQGESDGSKQTWANAYQSSLTRLIHQLRLDFVQPNLPVAIALIPLTSTQLTSKGYFPYANTVRNAQVNVSQTLPFVEVFDTITLPRTADNLHLNSQSLIEVGYRFAEKWFQLLPRVSP